MESVLAHSYSDNREPTVHDNHERIQQIAERPVFHEALTTSSTPSPVGKFIYTGVNFAQLLYTCDNKTELDSMCVLMC